MFAEMKEEFKSEKTDTPETIDLEALNQSIIQNATKTKKENSTSDNNTSEIVGNISFLSDGTINAKVTGNVTSSFGLNINSEINGNVECDTLVLNASISGSVSCKELILNKNAVINGSVSASKLTIV